MYPGRAGAVVRIGPAMERLAAVVGSGPVSVIDAARAVEPHGSLRYGYQTVKRAIAAGLVEYGPPLPGRKGRSLTKCDNRPA